ncbi:dihydrodipicolinate synthase family protein [Kineococcus sp. SYSU DK001]|uniref:dihydrodipicolinate synthase family protein n=1 Tax=Kineococcus sp. SYSU DK001 TaxID=3383122 RepID=UPI003D7C9083
MNGALAGLSEALRDVVAIPVTPFRDGVPSHREYADLLRRLVDAGVRVITPNGNTGEFHALTGPERRALLEVAARTVGADAHLLAGVGHDVQTAVAEAVHAGELGIPMVMVHQPAHPHVSRAGWLDYHRAVADAVPRLGVVPYVRQDWVDGGTLRELGELCPNVIGVKYALPDAAAFGRVRTLAGARRFAWIAGLAEPHAPSYAAHGADGFTSGLVNVNPRLSLRLRDALRAKDYERAGGLLDAIAEFEELRAADRSANNVSVVKEALHQLGWCERTVRAPSTALPPRERAAVSAILARWGAVDDLAPRRPAAGGTTGDVTGDVEAVAS